MPIGLWTDDFKQHLDNLTNNVDKNGKKIQPIVKDIDDMSKTTNVDFVVTFHGNHLQILETRIVLLVMVRCKKVKYGNPFFLQE